MQYKGKFKPERGERVLRESPAMLLRPHPVHDSTRGLLRVAVTVANWNYNGALDEVGGRLTVTDRRIYFEPHLLNIQWRPEDIPHADVAEVCDAGRLLRNDTLVRTKAGAEHVFRFTHNRNENNDMIEFLRQQARLVQEGGERASASGDSTAQNSDTDRKKGLGDLVLDLSDGVRFAGTRIGGKLLRDDKQENTASLASELERLARLRSEGVLTEEEFQAAKSRLIGGR